LLVNADRFLTGAAPKKTIAGGVILGLLETENGEDI